MLPHKKKSRIIFLIMLTSILLIGLEISLHGTVILAENIDYFVSLW